MGTQSLAPPTLNGAANGQKRPLSLPSHPPGNGASGSTLLSKPAPTNGHHNPSVHLADTTTLSLTRHDDAMPQTTIDHLDPAIQTQLRWILSRLDGHDAEFKATEARFEGVDKRLEIVGEGLGTAREERGNLKYRLDEAAALLKKFQEQQEKDALPLIKEIHDTTRLALSQADDIKELRQQFEVHQKETPPFLEELRKENKRGRKALRKAMEDVTKRIEKIEEYQRGQTRRFLSQGAVLLGIAVSATLLLTFFTQHYRP